MQYLFHLISRHQVLVLPSDLSGHVLMSSPHPPESQAIVGAPEMHRCHFFKQMQPQQSSKSMPGEHREKHVVLKA
jgi:hypothetical protein